jgi:hypothetical protein
MAELRPCGRWNGMAALLDRPRVGKQGGIYRNGSTDLALAAALRDDTQRLGSDLCGTSIIMTTYEILLTGTILILTCRLPWEKLAFLVT